MEAQFTFTTNNGAITITGYTGPGGGVVIPSATNGLPVVGMAQNAFYRRTTVTSVIIPDTFKNLGWMAFGYCTSLTNVIIGSGVTNIGGDAFYFCTNLTSVTIPKTVTGIDLQAFYFCTRLAEVTMTNGLTSIGTSAFAYCYSLPHVTIPGSVTNLGAGPFRACRALAGITVDGLNTNYCSVDGVLFNQSQTTLVQCPGGRPGSYTVPDSVTNLADASFLGCVSLTNITIPDTVLSLGRYTFEGCTALTNVRIPNSLTSIADFAFDACSTLPRVTIPNGVRSIGDYSFDGCRSLTNVTLPDTVTRLGISAFSSCTSLTNITLPRSVTSISQDTFSFCSNLASVFFMGDAPPGGFYAFYSGVDPTLYYLPGASGWDQWFVGPPAVLWNPQAQASGPAFGVHEKQFGFFITGTTNIPIVVEACTSLAANAWAPLQSCTLTNGSIYFRDPQWANYPARLYRIRSP